MHVLRVISAKLHGLDFFFFFFLNMKKWVSAKYRGLGRFVLSEGSERESRSQSLIISR